MYRLTSVVCLVALVFLAGLTSADVPKLINYQGMLTDAGGTPIDGTPNLTFRIYDDTTGAGTLQWSEVHNGVKVDNGLFNVILGTDSTLDLPFDKSYWLEVEVGGEVMPRIRFTSVGYAYRAKIADTATVAVFAPTGGGWTDDGSVVRLNDSDDRVGIGTSSPAFQLEVICDSMYRQAFRVGNSISWLEVMTGGNSRLGLGDGHGNEAGFIFTWETDEGENLIGISGCADVGGCPSLLTCHQNGGVGIGTLTPATDLDICGFPGNPTVARINQIGNRSWVGWRVDRDSTEKWFVGMGTTNENLLFRRGASSNDMVIDTFGNVGIGTSEPDRRLHIVGAGPRILIEGSTGNPEVNFKGAGDSNADIWALYKETISGDLRFYQNGNKMTIQNSTGNVGIGTATPNTKLAVSGLPGTGVSYNTVKVNTATGDFYYESSSQKYKEDVQTLEDDFNKILRAEPKNYVDKASGQREIGYIAEEFDEMGLKNLVIYDKEGEPDGLKYELVSLYLLEVMKDQAEMMKQLEVDNEKLRRRIEALEAR
jgi:hypothetical protein